MPAIILMAVWKNFGFNMVIFIAGLQSIPERLYEAASIDGAGGWQQFRHVTLPMLAPTFLFVGVMTMIGYFQLFAEPYVMTQGGPAHSTLSIVLLMYEEGFRWWNMGYAAAIAFVLFAIILVVTLLTLRCDGGAGVPAGGPPQVAASAPQDAAHMAQRTLVRRARRRRACSRCCRCSGWCRRRSCRPARPTALPPRLLPEPRRRSSTTRDLFTRLNLARYAANSAALARGRDARSRSCSTRWPATPSPSCASPAATASSASCSPRSSSPARWRCCRSFCMLKQLGLINTYWGVIIPGMASIFGIFLVRQYALSIPDSLLDAARIDGAGEFRIYWSLVLPRCTPILVTLGDLHVHGHVERLPLAVDRADRRATCTRCRSPSRTSSASTCRTPS